MKKLLIITSLFIGFYGQSQLDPNYVHFSFNPVNINPSFAGFYEELEATGLVRAQWVGFTGAPLSEAASVNTRLKGQKIGLGLSLNNTKMGPVNNTGVFGNFAYRLRIGYNSGYLSFGLNAGIYLRNNKLGDLNTITENDPEFLQNVTSQVLPNVGFGLNYQLRDFYVGISFPRLIKNSIDFPANSTGDLAQFNRLMYITAGGVYDLSQRKQLTIKPSFLFQYTSHVPPQLTLVAPIYMKDKIWAGPTFRISEAVGLLAGINITPEFSVGYSFDYSYQNTSFKYNGGSHELMLRFRMGAEKDPPESEAAE